MKNIFVRKILPVVMCLLMVVPMLVMSIGANPSATGAPGDKSVIGTKRLNWAPNGQTYHSSAWNYDSHSKYVNNGVYGHGYQMWRPTDPNRSNGSGVNPEKQYFGVSFDDGYYMFDEICIYAEHYEEGFNNIKYSIDALILGEWIEVGVGYQDQGIPTEYSGSGGKIDKIVIKLTHPLASEGEDINTNNIRIRCNEYGAYAKRYGKCTKQSCVDRGWHEGCREATVTSHDWWRVPLVHEVEMFGVTGYKPEFEVPMNAYLVTNAALSGMLGADSSMSMRYPGLAGDDSLKSSWQARDRGAQNIWAEFDKEYSIDNVGINVGGCSGADVGLNLTYNIKVLTSGTIEDGTWQTVVTGANATTTNEEAKYIIHDLDAPMKALGMMVEITAVTDATGKTARAVMTELWAEISEGKKCIFLATYITSAKKASTATGNLACYGNAYASSNFGYASASKINNIIDGNVGYSDDAWIAADYLINTYVGVILKEAHDITKAVLYFSDVLGGTQGEHVFKFELQAKVNGEFVTVAQATSYDAARKSYTVSIQFDEAVYTDDLRIVFKSDAHTFPYLKEFEIFSGNYIYSSYVGYALDTSRTKGGPAATTVFGERTVAQRGKYFDKQSPIEYFSIALEHDVGIEWLG